ncbi:putative RNA-directed DNA polymerase, eukaryota, reverse transcriptase zinc-binding domain protein [Tanacetum coccineum]
MMYQEFMKEQYEFDRKAKMQVIEQESEERRQLIHSQRIAEDMKVLQIDTRGLDPADAVIINAQKARIQAAYPPPPNQGDPLSPFLFILVMEGLHNAFEEAVGNGLITGVNIKNSTINVSHLFYADDVIITTDWNAKDMDNIIRVLHVFYLASGLKINIHKSNIYGIGVNKDEVLSMASNAGCIAGDIPFNYLGLPIGSNMKSIAS